MSAARTVPMRVLVTGASGFVGGALVPALVSRGNDVRAGGRAVGAALTRTPARATSVFARASQPARVRRAGARMVRCDLDDEASVRAALAGVDAAYYLVHGLKRGAGYGDWEQSAARRFVDACAAERVRRIVYLGGPDLGAAASAHLRARADTGAILRERGAAAGIDVVELRAAMILGARSDSFRLARDLAMRVPAIFASPWLETRQQPVAIDDVIVALAAALTVPAGVYDVPGPEALTGRELMERMKRACGVPVVVVPLARGSRRAAGKVAGWLTRVDAHVAQELVLGMGRGDLTATGAEIWAHVPGHARMGVDEALARALAQDSVGLRASLVESAVATLARVLLGRGAKDGA